MIGYYTLIVTYTYNNTKFYITASTGAITYIICVMD